LEYTSTARSVQPLRVSATSDFDGQRWLAPSRDGTEVQGSQLPPPTGLSPGAVASSEEVAVTVNTLQAPHLAVPVGTTSVSVSPPTVEVNENSQAVLLQSPVEAYSATYDELLPDGEPDPVGPSAQSVSAQDPRLVRVPESGIPAISTLTERIVGDQSDPLTVGRQLQEHFRSTDYTYSLDLGPEQPDAADDPISQFLATKQGYCVQFATAMVMMARSEGIPARMAVGFLPGEVQGDGSRRVVAADAHTWPELYIDGFGWTRFEPTPGARTGLPPQLTQTDTAESTPEQAPEVPETEPETDPEAGSSAPDSTGWDAVVAWFARWRWPIGFGVALVLALTVLPLASRWYRRHEARRRRSAHDHVESQWLLLTQSLADLGVPEPGPKSPRAMQTHYEDRAALDSDSHAALRRMSTRLEQTRYAADPGLDASAPQDMSTDVDVIVGSVRSSASWVSRARAALLPSAGRMAVRQWLHAATSQSTRIQSGGDQSGGDQSGGDQSR
ncbi:MAG: transglutaminase domain-containing protein, partial [Ornithinimicrobium sp.]